MSPGLGPKSCLNLALGKPVFVQSQRVDISIFLPPTWCRQNCPDDGPNACLHEAPVDDVNAHGGPDDAHQQGPVGQGREPRLLLPHPGVDGHDPISRGGKKPNDGGRDVSVVDDIEGILVDRKPDEQNDGGGGPGGQHRVRGREHAGGCQETKEDAVQEGVVNFATLVLELWMSAVDAGAKW